MPVVTKIPKWLEEHDFQRNSPEKQLGVKISPIQFIMARPPRLVLKRIVLPSRSLFFARLSRHTKFSLTVVWNKPSAMCALWSLSWRTWKIWSSLLPRGRNKRETRWVGTSSVQAGPRTKHYTIKSSMLCCGEFPRVYWEFPHQQEYFPKSSGDPQSGNSGIGR